MFLVWFVISQIFTSVLVRHFDPQDERKDKSKETDRQKGDRQGKEVQEGPPPSSVLQMVQNCPTDVLLGLPRLLEPAPGFCNFPNILLSLMFPVSFKALSHIFAISPTGVRTHPSSFKVMVEGWKERAGGGDEGKEGPEVVTARVA